MFVAYEKPDDADPALVPFSPDEVAIIKAEFARKGQDGIDLARIARICKDADRLAGDPLALATAAQAALASEQ